jgi:hypothetical protein
MSDLDPAATIESLLHDGARRRGMTLDAYRDLVQATADGARVGFATALLVITNFETMSPGERNTLVEQLAIIEKEATRCGVSVGRFLTIMLDDDGDSPARH